MADNDHLRKLIMDIDQWSPCMSYNDSYFGEPQGMLKQTIRQLAKEVEANAMKVCTASNAIPHKPLTRADLVDLAAKIQETLAAQEACTTYDQTYLDYLNAHSNLELSLKAATAKITSAPKFKWPGEEEH